jgi:hypothetical protein
MFGIRKSWTPNIYKILHRNKLNIRIPKKDENLDEKKKVLKKRKK